MSRRFITALWLGMAVLSCQVSAPPSTEEATSEYYLIDSTIQPDQTIQALILPYRDSVNNNMEEIIGFSTYPLIKKKPESPLSNFVSDLLLEAGIKSIQEKQLKPLPTISVININGLRTQIPKGPVSIGTIFELMPFENSMVILTMDGESILQLFKHMARSHGDGLAGGRFQYSQGNLKYAFIDDLPVKKGNQYRVITSDYLVDGGDHYDMLSQASGKYVTTQKIREIIINHIRQLTKNNQQINPSTSQRIHLE